MADPGIAARPPRLHRYPPTWFVALLWAIVVSVFVFRWDYGRFADFAMGASMGAITAWWLAGRLGRR